MRLSGSLLAGMAMAMCYSSASAQSKANLRGNIESLVSAVRELADSTVKMTEIPLIAAIKSGDFVKHLKEAVANVPPAKGARKPKIRRREEAAKTNEASPSTTQAVNTLTEAVKQTKATAASSPASAVPAATDKTPVETKTEATPGELGLSVKTPVQRKTEATTPKEPAAKVTPLILPANADVPAPASTTDETLVNRRAQNVQVKELGAQAPKEEKTKPAPEKDPLVVRELKRQARVRGPVVVKSSRSGRRKGQQK